MKKFSGIYLANVIQAGYRRVDVGGATMLYDQVWTEVKGGQ